MPLPNLTPLVSPTRAGDQNPAATLPSVVATAQFNVYAREQFRTHALAYGRRDTPFKVNAVDPGYTATDFNHHSGLGTVTEAAARVVKAALLGPDGLTSQFFSEESAPETGVIPW